MYVIFCYVTWNLSEDIDIGEIVKIEMIWKKMRRDGMVWTMRVLKVKNGLQKEVDHVGLNRKGHVEGEMAA